MCRYREMSIRSPDEKWVHRPREEKRNEDPYLKLLRMVCLKPKWPGYRTDRSDLYRRKICYPCYKNLNAEDTKYYTPASRHLLTLRKNLINFKYCMICTRQIHNWGVAAQCAECVEAFMHISANNKEALELGLSLNVLEAHERGQLRPQ